MINVLTIYLLLEIISTFIQFFMACCATYDYFEFPFFIWLNFVICTGITSVDYWFIFYYELQGVFLLYFRLIIVTLINVYALFLLVLFYLKHKVKLFSNFDEDFYLLSYEYTFQRLNNFPSRFWEGYLKKQYKEPNIEIYLQNEIEVKQIERTPVESYLNKSIIHKVIELFTPYNSLKSRRMIGDYCYFPIKLVSAIAISNFIYIYLTLSWIYYTRGIKKIMNGIRDILQVIAVRFSKEGLELSLQYFNAVYNAFIVTIILESLIIFIYSIYLLNAFY